MLLTDLTISLDEFERGTGWQLKPEGACRGDICVPLGDSHDASNVSVDVTAVAARLGMPVVTDERHGVSALGPWSGNGRALTSARAPELTLPDVYGNSFSLSSLLGQKVVLFAWAPF